MRSDWRLTRTFVFVVLPGMRPRAPKRNTIVLLVYLFLLFVVLSSVRSAGVVALPTLGRSPS
ncbi:hypothetical protein [Halosimplex amylolyticum]|uniref:hypothetical protein n=1 Tax=Halosimplex amylolyticum TaxID=3396616 RepID=UPI003F553462